MLSVSKEYVPWLQTVSSLLTRLTSESYFPSVAYVGWLIETILVLAIFVFSRRASSTSASV